MKYLLLAIRHEGIVYAALNYRFCIAHYKNQERLARQAADPIRQAAIAKYVDALYANNDLK